MEGKIMAMPATTKDDRTETDPLAAAEAALAALRRAEEAAAGGTAHAWAVHGEWQTAIRLLKQAVALCEGQDRSGYRIERDATGQAVRLRWSGDGRDGAR